LDKSTVFVDRYIRKLCGGSQSFLAEASDGFTYVVKFANNPQGPNIPFNESMGSELYRACRLPVPNWKPLFVTNEFLERNPACWLAMPTGRLVPNQGWCFAARFLGSDGKRLLEVLPGAYFRRVRNVWNFWLAWIVDICGDHADHRQALFEERPDRQLNPFFIDHGHLLGGPNGDLRRGLRACRYLDARIYRDLSSRNISTILKRLRDLDVDLVWQRAMELPDEWKTKMALASFTECLNRISHAQMVQTLVDEMIEAHKRTIICEPALEHPPVLHRGVQTESREFARTES
jgi:hypothetical protein